MSYLTIKLHIICTIGLKPDFLFDFKEVPPVIVSQKEDATLPCIDFDPVRHDRLRWIKSAYSRKPEIILSYPKPPNILDADRANWDPEQKSLILTDALKSDEGLYTCEVCSNWECTYVKNISLIVKGTYALF